DDRAGGTAQPLDLLHDPPALWLSLALALMFCSVAFSLSRGGLLSLLGGLAVGLVLPTAQAGKGLRAGGGLRAGAAALGLAAWFGTQAGEARLETVWKGDALRDGRLPTWAGLLGAVRDFPLWGTGHGTFAYVEPVYRTSMVGADLVWDH